MRTGDIDKLQLLGLEIVLSQFTLVGNQIYILLYLCDILKWKVGVYPLFPTMVTPLLVNIHSSSSES